MHFDFSNKKLYIPSKLPSSQNQFEVSFQCDIHEWDNIRVAVQIIWRSIAGLSLGLQLSYNTTDVGHHMCWFHWTM